MRNRQYEWRIERLEGALQHLRTVVLGEELFDDAKQAWRDKIRAKAILDGEDDPFMGLTERVQRLEANFRRKHDDLFTICPKCGQPRPTQKDG